MPRREGDVRNVCYSSPSTPPPCSPLTAWISASINPREAVSLFWCYLRLIFHRVKASGRDFQLRKKEKSKELEPHFLIFKELPPKNSCFTNSSDSKKNKPCQFWRMCSFLFAASGGKECSDALKHDGKRYPSKCVWGEATLLHSGWTIPSQFDFHLKHMLIFIREIAEAFQLQRWPDLASAFVGGRRRGNKNSTVAKWMSIRLITRNQLPLS